jgi:hypothetical protein
MYQVNQVVNMYFQYPTEFDIAMESLEINTLKAIGLCFNPYFKFRRKSILNTHLNDKDENPHFKDWQATIHPKDMEF